MVYGTVLEGSETVLAELLTAHELACVRYSKTKVERTSSTNVHEA